MIHDATVEVTCDQDGCHENVILEPEYVFSDYSGNNGHYDTRDRSLFKLLKAEGWGVDGKRTLCETHAPEDSDDEDDD